MAERTARERTLLLTMLLATVGMLTTALSIENVLMRTVIGAPLALILPGYALTEACLSRDSLGRLERFVFAVGVSLAVTVLGGVALHVTPWGLQPRSWALLLGLVTIGAGIIALSRSRQEDVGTRPAREGGSGPLPVIPLVLAGALTLAAVVIATQGALQEPQEGFTVLAIRPAAEESGVVTISIRNVEGVATSYVLEARQAGVVEQTWPDLTLERGEEWQETVAWPAMLTEAPIEFVLYHAMTPAEPYRRVVWWPSAGDSGAMGE